jgi:hypothetical protein
VERLFNPPIFPGGTLLKTIVAILGMSVHQQVRRSLRHLQSGLSEDSVDYMAGVLEARAPGNEPSPYTINTNGSMRDGFDVEQYIATQIAVNLESTNRSQRKIIT